MAVDSLDPCGIYFGTTGGQVYASADSGDTWNADRPRSAGGALGRSADAAMIRVVLPYHLRTLAGVAARWNCPWRDRHVHSILDALEARYPVLRGTMRDHGTLRRRPFIRFFACKEDLSHAGPETLLPEAVAAGTEPFLIVGAMAGG